ncbi:MAG: DUF1343 domain-containing protein [Gemmatimonas sp.]|nr:DUF1343 domain-containing protein [Gemmatimonas sp.]
MHRIPLLALSLAAAVFISPSRSTAQSPALAPTGLLGVSLEGTQGDSGDRGGVLTGAEVLLRDSLHLVRGRRVGLITNPTAMTRDRVHTIDLLNSHPEVRVQAMFAAEHGLRGGIGAGVQIENGMDPATGLPVRSIYGSTRKPTPEMLRDIDVLVFDMLDISARTYTYIWTMTLAMEAGAEAGIPFVILDRPNPVTGRVAGPLPTLDGLRTGPRITGHYPVPFRHGMTPGEIGRYVNSEYDVGARLTVVPMEGWRRSDWYDATGLPWINPSPNIRSLDAALNFGGLGTLEATALSLGRGTSEPFSVVGAPWLDVDALLSRLEGYTFDGVQLEPTSFTPSGDGWMQFRGRTVPGIQLRILDRDSYDPSYLALVLLTEIYRLHPRQLGMRGMKHILDDWTTDEIRRGLSPDQIVERWRQAGLGLEQAWPLSRVC